MKKKYCVSNLNHLAVTACLTLAVTSGLTVTSAFGVDNIVNTDTNVQIVLGADDTLEVTDSGSISNIGFAVIVNGTSGKIDNSGTISGNYEGVNVQANSDISGGIANNGTITGYYIGVNVGDNSDISGGIANNGTIAGDYIGVNVQDNSDISGGIANNGTISGDYVGVNVENNSDISGGILNTTDATITGATYGISVGTQGSNPEMFFGPPDIPVSSGSDISGGITNSGTILGGYGGIEDNAFSGKYSSGIMVTSNSDISGGITNSGTIAGDYSGVAVRDSSNISGGITNSGTISGDASGIGVWYGSDISGGVVNNGNLSATDGYGGIEVFQSSDISGGIINNSSISGIYGIDVYTESDISGGIINNADATITGSDYGVYLTGGSDISGGIVNNGTISGEYGGIIINDDSISGKYSDMPSLMSDSMSDSDQSTLSGGITNNGTISTSSGYALYLRDASANTVLPTSKIVVTNTGLIDGDVALTNNILNLNGTTGQVTGAVSGTTGSEVNVNGIFTTANIFEVDYFAINSGAVFNMAHGVTAFSGVSNAGTLAVAAGNSVTITGDYTQLAGGVFQTGATSSSEYGQLIVTGSADLTAGNTIDVNVTANDTLAEGDELSDVISAGALSAGSLLVTDNSAMWVFTGIVDGNTIDLTTSRNFTFVEAVEASPVVSPAAVGAAGALDAIQEEGATGDMQTVLNEMGALETEEEVAQAVGQNVPAFTGGVATNTLYSAWQGGVRVVRDRIHRQQSGLSSGDDLMAERTLWADTFYTNSDQSDRKGVYGYDADSLGLALGADTTISAAWELGASLSFASSDVDDDSPVTDDDLDLKTYQATLYAVNSIDENTTVNLVAAVGYNDNESTRKISFGGINRTANADYDSWHTHLDAELERDYSINDKTTVTPSVRARYSHISVESYQETGAGSLNLDVDSDSADSLVTSIDVKLQYDMTESLIATTHANLGYDFLTDQSSLDAAFTGGGPVFTTKGIDPAPVIFGGGVGLEYLAESGIKLEAVYDLNGREDYINQTAVVKFSLPF